MKFFNDPSFRFARYDWSFNFVFTLTIKMLGSSSHHSWTQRSVSKYLASLLFLGFWKRIFILLSALHLQEIKSERLCVVKNKVCMPLIDIFLRFWIRSKLSSPLCLISTLLKPQTEIVMTVEKTKVNLFACEICLQHSWIQGHAIVKVHPSHSLVSNFLNNMSVVFAMGVNDSNKTNYGLISK